MTHPPASLKLIALLIDRDRPSDRRERDICSATLQQLRDTITQPTVSTGLALALPPARAECNSLWRHVAVRTATKSSSID